MSSEVLVVAGLTLVLALAFARYGTEFLGRLHRAERHVAVMAASGGELPWESDAEGNMTFVGDLTTEYFGYEADEARSLNFRDAVHPQDYERLSALMESGSGWHHERLRCLHKDGSEHWFVSSAVPIVTRDGTLVGYTGSCHPLGKDALDEQRLTSLADDIYGCLDTAQLQSVFQPILSVETGRLVGAEALSRFPGSDRTPEQWFIDATEVGLSVELELAAVREALSKASQLPDDVYLSINVGPITLSRPELFATLEAADIGPQRIVLEITEHASITNYDQLLPAVHSLRAIGIRLAVDDAGAGFASFRHILRLTPEYIKLDRSLIAGIDTDPARRALAAAVVSFGSEMNATIIAEGVETVDELRCSQLLGIKAAQGYLFGRPTADWSTWKSWSRTVPAQWGGPDRESAQSL